MMRLISLLLFFTLPLGAEDTERSATESAPWTSADYARFTPATFCLYPPLLQVMVRAKLDAGLLNAAIFLPPM